MNTRIEHDTMGEIAVPAEHHWGAQTQRSLENFKIGGQRQPQEIITAFAYLKEACAQANADCGKLTAEQAGAIAAVCAEIRAGRWNDEFPLVVWQTGSGTQTNMNVNEVIAHLAADRGMRLHPNDHVNASQSSNDTFPSALHIAAALSVTEQVLPAAERLAGAFRRLEEAYPDLIRIGRTHLQDATPLKFAQEVSGWRELVEAPCRMLRTALPGIVSGAILAVARVIGETAPLLMTAGYIASTNVNLFSGQMTTLPVYVYQEYSKLNANCPASADASCVTTIPMERAWAAALVLILIVLILNLIGRLVAKIFAVKSER